MLQRILLLVALTFSRGAFAAEVPVQLEPLEVKGEVVPRSYARQGLAGKYRSNQRLSACQILSGEKTGTE